MREVRKILRRSHSKSYLVDGPSPAFMIAEQVNLEKRVRRLSRELNIAIASLGGTVVRLGEVAETLDDEWLVKESIFACRDAMRGQIENLTRLRRKIERAEQTDPRALALIE